MHISQLKNQAYRVKLVHKATGGAEDFVVQAHTFDNLNISLKQDWGSSIGSLIDKAIPEQLRNAKEAAAALTNTRITNPYFTALSWKASSPLEFPSIKLEWHAETDAKKDVVDNLIALISMAVPDYDDFLSVTAPGPSLIGQLTEALDSKMGDGSFQGESTEFLFGTYFRLKPVVITSIQLDIPSKFDQFGWPIHATAVVGISAFKGVFRRDVIDMFLGGNGTVREEYDP
jgi:hypothetical protein